MRVFAFWGTAALLALSLTSAYAQENVNRQIITNGGVVIDQNGNRVAPAQVTIDGTLASVLDKIDWEVAERGPLLIVAPERAVMTADETHGTTTDSYRLKTLVTRYNRKMVDVGNLTAVIPATMVVLNYDRLPEPNIYSDSDPSTIIPFLFATLSKSQWQQLMSSSGIGLSDLDKDQASMLSALVPTGTQIQRTMPGGVGSISPKTDMVEMTRDQMSGIRLCLYQQLSWNFLTINANGQNGSLSTSIGGQEAAAGLTSYRLQTPQKDWQTRQHMGYGVELWQERENRSKPSDIDYDAAVLNPMVSLANIDTVGDLIKHIHETLGFEIYCDPHYASLSVYHRGDSMRAGDVLKALALSVTGTYRKISDSKETAFVLTDDRVGLGARHLRIYEFMKYGALELQAVTQKAGEALKDSQADTVANVSQDGPYGIPDSLRSKIQTKDGNRFGQGVEIPLSELPEAAQAIARYQIETHKKWNEEGRFGSAQLKIVPDKVRAQPQLEMGILIPGIGTVPIGGYNLEGMRYMMQENWEVLNLKNLLANSGFPVPFALSKARAPERGLLVTVSSSDQATQWARLAEEKGYNRLLLKVYSDAEGATVKEWVAAARAAVPTIDVYLQIAVLRSDPATKSEIPAGELERNQLGETALQLAQRRIVEANRQTQKATREHLTLPVKVSLSDDWREAAQQGELLSPMVPGVTTGLGSHIADIVHTSGASGVVLTDLSLPGADRLSTPNTDNEYRDDLCRNFGYIPSARLAFLRETGTDPVDFSLTGGDYLTGNGRGHSFNVNVGLPFFPSLGSTPQDSASYYSRWMDFRKKSVEQLRQEIMAALQDKGITPVFLESERLPTNVEVAASALDKLTAQPGGRLPTVWEMDQKKVPYLYPFRFRDVPPAMRPSGMRVSERFARLASNQLNAYMSLTPMDPQLIRTTGGFLMDFTGQTPDEGRELLQDITIVP